MDAAGFRIHFDATNFGFGLRASLVFGFGIGSGLAGFTRQSKHKTGKHNTGEAQ